MLGKLLGKSKPKETWSDRAESYRTNLRDAQVEKNEADAAAKAGRQRRTVEEAPRSKGFGRRNSN